jgi:hypothetical protein
VYTDSDVSNCVGGFVERGRFNGILGVNALLPVHSPRILQTGLYQHFFISRRAGVKIPSQDFENKSGYTGNFFFYILY